MITDNLNEIMREAISKSKAISIHVAARMCDMKLNCHAKEHDERFCAYCEAMLDAADQIQQNILKLLKP